MTTVIIDYRMGNLRSVSNALESVGSEVTVSSRPEDLRSATRIILPGVGAFGDGMKNLEVLGFIPVLREEVVERGKPLLGICLGMQLFGSLGLEFGEHKGLGWIPGTIDRLRPSDPALRIPHIGWNDVKIVRENPLFTGIPDETSFYFVHSYHLAPSDPGAVIGSCDYKQTFAAAVRKGNIFGVQFHPEKSHRYGIKLLENFVRLPIVEKARA